MENKAILKAEQVRLIISDVDGVLTDGRLYYQPGVSGHMKAFHVRDGMGVQLAREAGLEVALISAKPSSILMQRAKELHIHYCLEGVADKLNAADQMRRELELTWKQVAMIGDDLLDLPLLRTCGFSATVSDAVREIRESVDYVSFLPGGSGAFRDIVEFILRASNRWDDLIARYGGQNEVR